MTKPLVYIETTIPSFYYEKRTAPGIVARREWTQQWWDTAPERFVPALVTPLELLGGSDETEPE
ncbi:MAG: hypothetical protein OXI53_02810 [Nitrospira sp.]|nr:hypothetical protein [Nitrospira sp.]MDE0486981.1 hypothetical protein [Nitrospira sp.]